MKIIKKFTTHILIALTLTLIFSLTSCGAGKKDAVGISAPTAADDIRWAKDIKIITDSLKKSGYKVDVKYAGSNAETQVSQLYEMINSGVKAIVLIPAESTGYKTALREAGLRDIKILLHDKLVLDTPNIDFYNTFDYSRIGMLQAAYIIAKLDPDNNDKTFNIEIFSGSQTDHGAMKAYSGGMNVLKPYIEKGRFNIVSGETGFYETATDGGTRENAAARMSSILSTYYADGKNLDAIFAADDIVAAGAIDTLTAAGKSVSVITGQDVYPFAVKNIADGKQTISIFKDPSLISERTAKTIDELITGKQYEYNTSIDNNVKNIPSYVNDISIIDINNYRKILIDSGYYKESDIK